MKNIYLIGFMGVGKSTVSAEFAAQTGAEQLEMDQLITEQQGMKISDIFAQYGEEYFRDLETELLRSFLTKQESEHAVQKENFIISCGGGSVLRDENARLMKQNGCIVLLTAAPETIYERVKDSTERPILNGNMNVAFIRELMEKRRSRYEAVADITVATDGKSAAEICEEILQQMER